MNDDQDDVLSTAKGIICALAFSAAVYIAILLLWSLH
jgi:hypothetical protein